MSKSILKYALIAPAAVAAVGCCSDCDAPKQPNVIVILADDLGYGDMSAYGAEAISTPNLDKLANNGVRFTDGHATSATSTPSRYAMFTGMYPWKNPNARILPADAPLLVDVDQFTMPKMFRSMGYSTAAIGKWHLGMGAGNPNWNETVVPGANQIGFDYSCLIAATNDRVPTVFVENGDVVGLDPNDPIEVSYKKNFEGEPTALTNPERLKLQWAHGHNQSIVNGIPRIGYMKGGEAARWVDEDMADYFVGKVRSFLDEKSDEPFFLYYGLHQPHVPRAPHSRFVGSTKLGARGDAIVEADWCVGELIKMLEEKGILENTLIIFSSDNGPVLNDGYKDLSPELCAKYNHSPRGPLRGGKYSIFDGGTRVPFFTYWKGHIEPRVSDALISQHDIVASMAKLIGAEMPEGIDSQEHLDVFMGKCDKGRESLVVEANGMMAFRTPQYAMLPPYKGKLKNETGNEIGIVKDFALYDLLADIEQQNDIATQKPEVLAKMKGEFMDITKGYYKANVKETKLE